MYNMQMFIRRGRVIIAIKVRQAYRCGGGEGKFSGFFFFFFDFDFDDA